MLKYIWFCEVTVIPVREALQIPRIHGAFLQAAELLGLVLALVVAGGGRAEEGDLAVRVLHFHALGVTLCCCQPRVWVFSIRLLHSGLAPAITCTVFNYVASVPLGRLAFWSPFVGSNPKIPDKCICACSPCCSLLVLGARCKLVPLHLRGCWVNFVSMALPWVGTRTYVWTNTHILQFKLEVLWYEMWKYCSHL